MEKPREGWRGGADRVCPQKLPGKPVASQSEDFEELNQIGSWKRCQKYGSHRIAGREDDRTVQERFEGEKSRLLPLRFAPLVRTYKPLRVKVDRYQTVRVDRNRYSVPRAYVGRWVWAHVSCWQVEVFAEDRKIGEHERVVFQLQVEDRSAALSGSDLPAAWVV